MKKVLFLSIIFILAGCEVTFNSDYKRYIDNIADRTPLKFTISGGEIIENVSSVNLGFQLSDYTKSITITNSEDVDIFINKFDGVSGDFNVQPLDSFVFKKSASITMDITFNASTDNFNKRVTQALYLVDKDGRKFRFDLWATSKRQPVAIYNSDNQLIEAYDLGKDSSIPSQKIYVKNEGLKDINVLTISSPSSAIKITKVTPFKLKINEKKEITLSYTDLSVTVEGSGMGVTTDDLLEPESFSLPLYAGGDLKINVLDSSDAIVSGSINMGTYTSGDPITGDYKLENISLFTMELEVSINSDIFTTDLGQVSIPPGEKVAFKTGFLPRGLYEQKSAVISVKDSKTKRVKNMTVTGVYSK